MSAAIPPADARPTTYNLLFVCTGNTCRSPLAAAIARRLAGERGWHHVAVRSAGTGAVEGGPASEPAIHVAGEHGLDLSGHDAARLSEDLVRWADLVLGMSPSHLAAVADLDGGGKVALVTDFADGPDAGQPVEDPFGSDLDAYRRAYQQLEAAVGQVIARLEPILSP
jgi:protein-tyrosine-phosphatase